jgi:DNA-directed RNA polymerase specialized sigma24 family protein
MAEDLVQDTFLAAIKSQNNFSGLNGCPLTISLITAKVSIAARAKAAVKQANKAARARMIAKAKAVAK